MREEPDCEHPRALRRALQEHNEMRDVIMGERAEERRLWHIGKEIPLAIIVAIGLQTFGVVWWFANLSAKVDNIDAKVAALSASAVTAAEARGSNELNSHRNIEQDRRIGELEKQLRTLENQHQQMVLMFQRNGAHRR